MFYELKEFGIEIKNIRLSMNYRQSDVTKMIGVNEDTLRRLEGGVSQPRIDTLDLLSIAYKRDIYEIFKKHKQTPSQYIDEKMKEIASLSRTYKYDEIKKVSDEFWETFSKSSFKQIDYIESKMKQLYEYLSSLSNMEKSFVDKSRNDLSKLINCLGLSLNDINNADENIHLDKMEIRIFVLISIIYRYKMEFKNSKTFLKIALRELNDKHSYGNDYLYFYLLIVNNLMTVYHRLDDYEELNSLYIESLKVFESKIGIISLSSYFVRIGINNYFLKDNNYNEFIKVALDILSNSEYKNVANKYENNFRELYKFLDI